MSAAFEFVPSHVALVSTDKIVAASFGQARLWFLRQLMPCKTAYNTAVYFRLEGDLDERAIDQAFREIVRRHEALRTTFLSRDGSVLQVISAAAPADVALVDLSMASDVEAEARAFMRGVSEEAFDLDEGPLFRVRIVRLAARSHLLLVVLDHIVGDGLSLGILWRELEALYDAYRRGERSPLEPPARQYSECIAPQEEWMRTPAFARHLAYWEKHLAGSSPCDLPEDRPRPPIKSYRGGFEATNIEEATVDRLRALCAKQDVSLFTGVLATLNVLLARYSGQSDVLVMIPVGCRQRFGTQDVVGFFANMVVLRTQIVEGTAVTELLEVVNKEVVNGVLRQDVPFDKVIEALKPERSLSHDPVARIALSFLPRESATLNLPGIVATYGETSNGGSKFDLHVTVVERERDLSCTASYNSDVFEPGTMHRFLAHYERLLESVALGADKKVTDLRFFDDAERRRIVDDYNDTAADYRRDATIHGLFGAAASAKPSDAAASFEGDTITYGALDRRSNQVARCLAARGVVPGVLVGISVERSLDMLVGLLGILKAGGAYVPLDPAYPRDRLAFMVEDAHLGALVTEDRHRDLLPEHTAPVLLLDGSRDEIDRQSADPLDVCVDSEALAYVIYTSGSTGKPKGVQIPHRAVVNFLTTMAARPGLRASDRVLALTSLSFDIAGLELWLPLTVGAHVEIVGARTASDGSALAERIRDARISMMQATPSTYRLLLDAGWQGDGALSVLVGGEAVPPDLADKLLDRAGAVWNMYGPTETTIWSSIHRLEKGAPVLIGRPIANTQAHILDKNLALVATGVTGELYLGGDGLARGYLRRAELTEQRFIADPFSKKPGARLYRTGDLARRKPDGAIEFIGRADFQVKLRGYRVELGEIEAVLAEHPGVREAFVVVHEDTLVAYITSATEEAPSPADLRAHMKTKLPDYMVAARFVVLKCLPLTSNNKVDRKALPKPDEGAVAATGGGPREALEFDLRAIWEEVLGVRGIGVDDSFFDVGGHSLLALKLFDRIHKALGIHLPVTSLFEAPTIAGLAGLLRKEGWEASWSSLVPIQTSGTRRPFFCVHAVGGNVLNYRLLSKYLGNDQPFYGLQSRGLGGGEAPHDTVEAMAAAYLDEIAKVQPRGPYLLGGASSGGVIAYEMAQQLAARGDRAELLVMMDTTLARPRCPTPLARIARKLDYHLGNLLLRTPGECMNYLGARIRGRLDGTSSPIVKTMKSATDVARHVFESNVRALETYVPKRYAGGVVMLVSRNHPERTVADERLTWAELADGLTVRFIPGNHDNILQEPNVGGVADQLSMTLSRCAAPA